MKIQHEGFLGRKNIHVPESIQGDLSRDPASSQLYLTDIGYYPSIRNHNLIRTDPLDQHILICCIDGEGWCRLEGRRQGIKKNQYFVIPAGKEHAYGNAAGKSWSIYWVHFRGNQGKQLAAQLCDTPCGKGIPLVGRKESLHLFHGIISDLENGISLDACIFANARLWHLLGDIIHHRRFIRDKDKDTIDQAIQFMREHVEETLSLDELADYSNLSVTYFCRLFKTRMKQTPVDYFIRLKIQCASQCLAFTDMAIRDVGQQFGYDDPYYFSRVFKRVMGMSPKSYRKTHQY